MGILQTGLENGFQRFFCYPKKESKKRDVRRKYDLCSTSLGKILFNSLRVFQRAWWLNVHHHPTLKSASCLAETYFRKLAKERITTCLSVPAQVTCASSLKRAGAPYAAGFRPSTRRAGGGTAQPSAASAQPHTSFAISTTSRTFAHCSSSVSLLPISHEAKPHCGDKYRRSSGTYLEAS